jgi:hypothetical protein
MSAAPPRLKYLEKLEKCAQPCPNPRRFEARSIVAFRFMRSPERAEDFLPVSELPDYNPARGSCEHHSLSFFDTLANAKKKWELLNERQDAASRYGTHVGEVALTKNDGLSCSPGKSGHFDLHEFVGVSFVGRVAGHSPLVPAAPTPARTRDAS